MHTIDKLTKQKVVNYNSATSYAQIIFFAFFCVPFAYTLELESFFNLSTDLHLFELFGF